jgi:hypothetical protein
MVFGYYYGKNSQRNLLSKSIFIAIYAILGVFRAKLGYILIKQFQNQFTTFLGAIFLETKRHWL